MPTKWTRPKKAEKAEKPKAVEPKGEKPKGKGKGQKEAK